jgi:ATP-dependent Lhr-like helicase
VRTGDTTQAERNAMRKRPPHILVTTPESLYVLLGSDSGRAMLATVRTVIVDEIHAVAGSKRGSHLALSLERLDALCAERRSGAHRPVRHAEAAVGGGATSWWAVAAAHARWSTSATCARATWAGTAAGAAEAVMPNEVWERVYDRMAELVVLHRTTLIFVNTRRMAERMARHLATASGRTRGGPPRQPGQGIPPRRRAAPQGGDLQVLVATASLELGIDIGDVDLVCQIGSPRNIAAFLQRVGRSGHHVGGMPKGRLFPTSRDDLVECAALLDCVRRGELDTLRIPRRRWTCWPSRSWPKWPAANGARTRCST